MIQEASVAADAEPEIATPTETPFPALCGKKAHVPERRSQHLRRTRGSFDKSILDRREPEWVRLATRGLANTVAGFLENSVVQRLSDLPR